MNRLWAASGKVAAPASVRGFSHPEPGRQDRNHQQQQSGVVQRLYTACRRKCHDRHRPHQEDLERGTQAQRRGWLLTCPSTGVVLEGSGSGDAA